MTNDKGITVVGAGMAGSEAAWQIANAGIRVRLVEMRPLVMTPAHSTDRFGELVCSNSLGSKAASNAGGILKEEMRILDSLIMKAADAASIPAGGALAVDRDDFSGFITDSLESNPNVFIEHTEVPDIQGIEDDIFIIATGPLTSPALTESIKTFTGDSDLYFYDAAAPVLTLDSIDMDKAFWASRYDEGEGDYLNCPMDKNEYEAFHTALTTAERAPFHDFEEPRFFEGCMPIEQMADRGVDTIRFGPMKPVGIRDPKTGRNPYAVVQLRKDNREGTLLNMVGFQTRLKWPDQIRVFRMIPGMENAEFVRLGVVHRNTYINSPKILNPTYETHLRKGMFFAGQLTGVEGYMESTASGLLAGINAARLFMGLEPAVLPETTLMGALAHYITTANPDKFQPMNANIGILPPLENKVRDKKQRNTMLGTRAIEIIMKFRKFQ